MKSADQKPQWFHHRFEYAIDCIRVFVGLALFVRGVILIGEDGRTFLFDQINSIGSTWAIPYILAHYIILAHVVGGLLLALGVLTRAMAAIQIPILAGAALFVHRGPLLTGGQELELSVLLLFLLILLAVCGPGRLSFDVSALHRMRPPKPLAGSN